MLGVVFDIIRFGTGSLIFGIDDCSAETYSAEGRFARDSFVT
jgi:hypothetical protein